MRAQDEANPLHTLSLTLSLSKGGAEYAKVIGDL